MFKRIAIFPGTFIPLHSGHIDIIKKAAKLFDKLIIVVSINIDKNKLNIDSLNIHKKQIQKEIKKLNLKNVKVISWSSYTIDVAKKYNAGYIIRGVRNIKDFKNELYIASVNKKLNSEIETIVFFADEIYRKISSTAINNTLKKHDKYFNSIIKKK